MATQERPTKLRGGSNASRPGTIRTRLLVAFVLMVLLPAAAISAGSVVTDLQGGRQQARQQLELLAVFKESQVGDWVRSLHPDLVDALEQEDTFYVVYHALDPDVSQAEKPDLYRSLEVRFQRHIQQTELFDGMLLLDLEGNAIVATDEALNDTVHSDQRYFQEGLKRQYVNPPFDSALFGQPVVVVSQPALDNGGQIVGVLAGYASTNVLDTLMSRRVGMSEGMKTYLVGLDNALVTEPGSPTGNVHSEGVDAALTSQTNGAGLYRDYLQTPVVGVYHWLPELQVALLAEQDQTQAFKTTYVTLGISVGVALISALAAVLASLRVTQGITGPITRLVEVTDRISMGDLDVAVGISSKDEIGALAESIDRMRISLKAAMERLTRKT